MGLCQRRQVVSVVEDWWLFRRNLLLFWMRKITQQRLSEASPYSVGYFTSMTEINISLCTRLFISQRISLKCKLQEAMELNDEEVSSYSRSHTGKQLNSDILITFLMKHVPPYKYIEFPGNICAMKCSFLIKRDILRRHRNLIKSVTDVIFVWPLDGTHVFCINY